MAPIRPVYFGCSTLLTIGPHRVAPNNSTATIPIIHHTSFLLTFEPVADSVDMIHLTDLYTTAARLGGALDKIPSCRVVDGVDQTALLLLGEGHSRRDYMFYYSGSQLGAARWRDIKSLIEGPGHGGLPGLTMCEIKRDPGER
jgi:hypothetical protein